jgi:hypothetical protein
LLPGTDLHSSILEPFEAKLTREAHAQKRRKLHLLSCPIVKEKGSEGYGKEK